MKKRCLIAYALIVVFMGVHDLDGMNKKEKKSNQSNPNTSSPKLIEKKMSMMESNDQRQSTNQTGPMDKIIGFTKNFPSLTLTKKKSQDNLDDSIERRGSVYSENDSQQQVVTKKTPPMKITTLTNSIEEHHRHGHEEDKAFKTTRTAQDLNELRKKALYMWWEAVGRKNLEKLGMLCDFLATSPEVKNALDMHFNPEKNEQEVHPEQKNENDPGVEMSAHSNSKEMSLLLDRITELFTKCDYGLNEEERENLQIYKSILAVKQKNKEKRARISDDDIFGTSPK